MADVVLRGLAFPFRREATGFAVAESLDKVKQALKHVLATPKGTLPWRPEFGSELHRLRHMSAPMAQAAAPAYVARALERWIPYVRLLRVHSEVVGTTLRLTISYKIVSGPATRSEPVEQSVTIQP